MQDFFDNTIICAKCGKAMEKASVVKDGFILRAVLCKPCGNKAIHPSDIKEYQRFKELRNKTFRMKLRVVGNSYAVSIPKEIVDFMQEQESVMNDLVQLCFKEFGKLSLEFGGNHDNDEK